MTSADTNTALPQPDGHPGDVHYLGHVFEPRTDGLTCRSCGCLAGSYDGAYNCNPPQTPLHQDAYERELDALTRQLIIAAGLNYKVVPNVLPQSTERFRLIAKMAVALVESNTLTRMKLELVAYLSDDRDTVRDVPGYTREVVDETISKLMQLGGAR